MSDVTCTALALVPKERAMVGHPKYTVIEHRGPSTLREAYAFWRAWRVCEEQITRATLLPTLRTKE